MTRLFSRLRLPGARALRGACLVLAAAAVLAPPSRADSLASSASSAGSASVGSLSDSFRGSSHSSSGDRRDAAGDYRVIEVADAADRPGVQRLVMQPVQAARGAQAEAPAMFLYVPKAALEGRPLGVGDVVQALARPYGYAFARAGAAEAFFLALDDDWHGALDPHALRL